MKLAARENRKCSKSQSRVAVAASVAKPWRAEVPVERISDVRFRPVERLEAQRSNLVPQIASSLRSSR
jgi:hypothetical protein